MLGVTINTVTNITDLVGNLSGYIFFILQHESETFSTEPRPAIDAQRWGFNHEILLNIPQQSLSKSLEGLIFLAQSENDHLALGRFEVPLPDRQRYSTISKIYVTVTVEPELQSLISLQGDDLYPIVEVECTIRFVSPMGEQADTLSREEQVEEGINNMSETITSPHTLSTVRQLPSEQQTEQRHRRESQSPGQSGHSNSLMFNFGADDLEGILGWVGSPIISRGDDTSPHPIGADSAPPINSLTAPRRPWESYSPLSSQPQPPTTLSNVDSLLMDLPDMDRIICSPMTDGLIENELMCDSPPPLPIDSLQAPSCTPPLSSCIPPIRSNMFSTSDDTMLENFFSGRSGTPVQEFEQYITAMFNTVKEPFGEQHETKLVHGNGVSEGNDTPPLPQGFIQSHPTMTSPLLPSRMVPTSSSSFNRTEEQTLTDFLTSMPDHVPQQHTSKQNGEDGDLDTILPPIDLLLSPISLNEASINYDEYRIEAPPHTPFEPMIAPMQTTSFPSPDSLFEIFTRRGDAQSDSMPEITGYLSAPCNSSSLSTILAPSSTTTFPTPEGMIEGMFGGITGPEMEEFDLMLAKAANDCDGPFGEQHSSKQAVGGDQKVVSCELAPTKQSHSIGSYSLHTSPEGGINSLNRDIAWVNIESIDRILCESTHSPNESFKEQHCSKKIDGQSQISPMTLPKIEGFVSTPPLSPPQLRISTSRIDPILEEGSEPDLGSIDCILSGEGNINVTGPNLVDGMDNVAFSTLPTIDEVISQPLRNDSISDQVPPGFILISPATSHLSSPSVATDRLINGQTGPNPDNLGQVLTAVDVPLEESPSIRHIEVKCEKSENSVDIKGDELDLNSEEEIEIKELGIDQSNKGAQNNVQCLLDVAPSESQSSPIIDQIPFFSENQLDDGKISASIQHLHLDEDVIQTSNQATQIPLDHLNESIEPPHIFWRHRSENNLNQHTLSLLRLEMEPPRRRTAVGLITDPFSDRIWSEQTSHALSVSNLSVKKTSDSTLSEQMEVMEVIAGMKELQQVIDAAKFMFAAERRDGHLLLNEARQLADQMEGVEGVDAHKAAHDLDRHVHTGLALINEYSSESSLIDVYVAEGREIAGVSDSLDEIPRSRLMSK
eukprot:Ihof_evm2s157 gene=Ihof_evmTU2s157